MTTKIDVLHVQPGSIIVATGLLWSAGMADQFMASLAEKIPHRDWILVQLESDAATVEIQTRDEIAAFLARLDGAE